MSLRSLLEIDVDFLTCEQMQLLEVAESKWIRAGKPTDRWVLFDFLGGLIDECAASGIQYPAVLLKRKGGLKRGTFVPVAAVKSSAVKTRQTSEETPAPGQCAKCGGRGYVVTIADTGTLCDCEAAKPKQQSRK
jgi:hypothetical protein